MKQTLLTLLCALMATITASAYSFEVDGIYYDISGSDAIVTSGSSKYKGNISIPDSVTYNGTTYTVTSIGYNAFYYCTSLTSVTIPNSVTSIIGYAFQGCTGLTEVTIPESITSIGRGAFDGCSGLTKVNISDISAWFKIDYANYSRSSPSNPLYYAKKLYVDGKLVTNLVIPESVTEISAFAFHGCTSLTEVSIPTSVTSIGDGAFDGCTGLRKVNISDISAWCKIKFESSLSSASNPLCYAHNLYIDGELVTNLVIPQDVTTIGSYAFSGCTGLTSVTIPNSVTSIGSSAFSGCTGLTSVTIPNSVTSIGSYAFNYCSGLTEIDIPSSVTSIGSSAFNECTGLTKVNISDISAWCKIMFESSTSNPLTYAHNLYFDGELVTNLVIPQDVTTIVDYAFNECNSLKSVTIPNSVTSIGRDAFNYCRRLNSVSIPGSITKIGKAAFWYCSLFSVTVDNDNPANITLGGNVFYGPVSTCKLYVPKGSKELYATADQWKSFKIIEEFTPPTKVGLTYEYTDETHTAYKVSGFTNELPADVIIPAEYNGLPVIAIGNGAFSGCESLASIEIPSSVTSIGTGAFQGCANLMSFMGKFASEDNRCLIIDGALVSFAPCGLTSYSIPESVTSIGEKAFHECESLASIEIPNSVTSIGAGAFQSCTNLASIEIPESVASIGAGAFQGCANLMSFMGKFASEDNRCLIIDGALVSFAPYGLTSYTIPNTITSIGDFAFMGCSGLTSLTVNNENPANISLGSDVFTGVPTSACTLYVPRGSKQLYAAADQWKDFANIVEYGPISLSDGEAYTATEDETDVDVNYTRNFTDTYWQPLYVPFNMSYEEWSEYADVAEVHNVRGYDTDDDGVIDDVEIEFNMISSGEIVPNIPYVIKAKNTGEVTFECKGKTLLAAPAKEGSVECSSTKMTYSLHGVYQPKTDMFSTGAYQLRDNAFHQATSDETVLAPNRFYLLATPKTGGYKPTSAPKMIKILVNGNGTTTSVEEVGVDTQKDDTYYDLMGRRVVYPTRGIYIQNGRKVFVK